MSKDSRPTLPLLGLAALAVVLAGVLVAVLDRRFAAGEIYPHYSTIRSDPLGASALYESLSGLRGYEVVRNRRNLMALDTLDGEAALWLCGLSRQAFEGLQAPPESPVLKAVEEQGARLVITLNPEWVPETFDLKQEEAEGGVEDWIRRRKAARDGEAGEPGEAGGGSGDREEKESDRARKGEAGEKAAPEGDSGGGDEGDEGEEDPPTGPLLTTLFEVGLDTPRAFERPEAGWSLMAGSGVDADRPLPGALPAWRSHLRFTDLGADWKVAASVEGKPVVIERSFGAGSVVLASDSYFASNEALWRGGEPEFLLWLAGGKTRIVFDETIHGTVESGGVMKMIRRYRFHGFLMGCLLVVALLAWKSASPLAPGSEGIERGLLTGSEGTVAGETTAAGFIRLLQRSIPKRRLLRTCLETWRETAGKRMRGESVRQREAVDALLARHEAAPSEAPAVETYENIARVLGNPDAFRDRPERENPA